MKTVHASALILAATFSFASGCVGQPAGSTASHESGKAGEISPEAPRPRINSIGLQSIVTFENSTVAKPTRIVIPIEGVHLRESADGASNLTVQVVGTVPADPDADYVLKWPAKIGTAAATTDTEVAYVELQPGYVSRLKSHDRLRIVAAVHRKAINASDGSRARPESTAFAHREFVLYEVGTYRTEVATSRVPTHDIQALPLPEAEVRYLFGPLVERSYFVVRLTVRNTADVDKLINSGMINATGRAIVVPQDRSQPTFTVPVTLSPQGPVQVYTILDDRGSTQARARLFRTLEFIGALGSAAVTSFNGASEDLVKGTALFTGVFVPEAGKLFPDRWPNYKRNLVTFAMPELTKVPRQSTTSPKYLFFPKRELELLVSDQALYENPPTFAFQEKLPWRTTADNAKPVVRVVSLGFDSLDIPFENAVAPAKVSLAGQIAELGEQTEMRVTELSSAKARVDSAADADFVIGRVTRKQLKDSSDHLDKVTTLLAGTSAEAEAKTDSDAEKKKPLSDVKDALVELKSVAKSLVGLTSKTGDLYQALFTNSDDASFSLLSLEKAKRTFLNQATIEALTFSDSQTGGENVGKVRRQLDQSAALYRFIAEAETRLTDDKFVAILEGIEKDGAKKALEPAQTQLILNTYGSLKDLRTVLVLKEFDPAGYKALAQSGTGNGKVGS